MRKNLRMKNLVLLAVVATMLGTGKSAYCTKGLRVADFRHPLQAKTSET